MKKEKGKSSAFTFAAFICFTFALSLLVLLRLFQLDSVVEWYHKYTDTLSSYELWMQNYGASWFSVLIILLNYVVKALVPWFPISCICVACGVVFKWYFAIAINVVGLTILFTIKFFWGKRFGGGNAEKILARYDKAHSFIDSSKLGSTLVLFVLRLVPCMPINSVSRLYGTTTIKYPKYLIVSVLGFTYKLFSYTVIGRNVFDPMSASFILPMIMLSVFSGIVLLVLNGVITIKSSVGKNKKQI